MGISSKQDFIDYCLRQLGGGMIDVEITPEQLEDAYEHALQYYQEYHYDGMERDFYVYKLTNTDITNKYITLPDTISGVTRVMSFSSMFNSAFYAFNPQYQLIANEIQNMTSSGGINYFYSVMDYLANIEFVLQKEKSFRYNRRMEKLYLDINWGSEYKADDYIGVEVYKVLDPETYNDVWNDRWFKEYATAQMKKTQGTNLKKYTGAMLPGGIQYNGQQIYNEALQEIDALEEEMKNNSAVLNFMVG